jgi:hypothetical protein
VPAMPVTGLSKSWMKFSILYHKNIKNFWNNGQLSHILGNNKQRSKFSIQKLLFDVVHSYVNCIKLGCRHLKQL